MAATTPTIETAQEYAGTAASAGTGDAAWLNPTNAQDAPDSSEADSEALNPIGNADTAELRMTNYGFLLPDNGTWVGLVASLTRRGTAARIQDRIVRLFDAALQGDNQLAAGAWPAVAAALEYGGAADRWGAAAAFPLLSDFNAAAFGISVAADDIADDGDAFAFIDACRLTIFWTLNEIGPETSFAETALSDTTDQSILLGRADTKRMFRLKRLLLNVTAAAGGTLIATVKDDQGKAYTSALHLNSHQPTDLKFDPPLVIDKNRDLRLIIRRSSANGQTLSGARAYFDSILV